MIKMPQKQNIIQKIETAKTFRAVQMAFISRIVSL